MIVLHVLIHRFTSDSELVAGSTYSVDLVDRQAHHWHGSNGINLQAEVVHYHYIATTSTEDHYLARTCGLARNLTPASRALILFGPGSDSFGAVSTIHFSSPSFLLGLSACSGNSAAKAITSMVVLETLRDYAHIHQRRRRCCGSLLYTIDAALIAAFPFIADQAGAATVTGRAVADMLCMLTLRFGPQPLNIHNIFRAWSQEIFLSLAWNMGCRHALAVSLGLHVVLQRA